MWTDFVQTILMIIGAMILMVLCMLTLHFVQNIVLIAKFKYSQKISTHTVFSFTVRLTLMSCSVCGTGLIIQMLFSHDFLFLSELG